MKSHTVLFSVLLVAVVASLYSNTLFHDFVFDDVTLIQQNPDVIDLNWGNIFGRSGYRPVRTFTYPLNSALGGMNPFGYHLFNLLLHAANSLLVFLFLRSIQGWIDVSFLGAMLFAVHPVQTASVAYISGRKDLLAAFFVLLALLFYNKWRRQGGWQRLTLTVSALLLAILSKEVAVVFLVLFVLVDLCRRGSGFQLQARAGLIETLKQSAFLYSVLVGAALAAVYYAVVWTEASRLVDYWGGTVATQWATSFKLFVHYLRLALVPYPLLADYIGVFPISTGFAEPATLFCLVVSIGYAALVLWSYPRWPLVTLGMGWFLVPLLPVLQIVGFHEIAADHFLYLPMVGMALIFGHLGARAAASRKINVLAWAFLLFVLSLCSVLTVTRNRVWADQLTLWEDTYQKAPGSYRANANLGQLYFERFLLDLGRNPQLRRKAIGLSEEAAELNPTDSLPLSNLGAIYRDWGYDQIIRGNWRLAEELENRALDYLTRAVSLEPDHVWNQSNLGDVRQDLGTIWAHRGNPLQAETERQLATKAYRRAIDIGSPHPRFPLVYYKFAMVKVNQRRFAEAVPWLEKSVTTPALAHMGELPYRLMGYCYLATGRVPEAIPHLKRSVSIRPHPAGLRLLAYALEGEGQAEEAMTLYQQALQQDPESYETHFLLGVALQQQEKEELALGHLQRALEWVGQRPGTPSAIAFRRSIEAVLEQLGEGRQSVEIRSR